MDIVTPVVHRNGDRKETLIKQLEVAYRAVHAAQLALRECAGNRRNFYVDEGRWEAYRIQHQERMAHLEALRLSLVAEVEQIEKENS